MTANTLGEDPTPEQIVQHVSVVSGVPVEQLRGKSKKAEVSNPRLCAFVICREFGSPIYAISEALGRSSYSSAKDAFAIADSDPNVMDLCLRVKESQTVRRTDMFPRTAWEKCSIEEIISEVSNHTDVPIEDICRPGAKFKRTSNVAIARSLVSWIAIRGFKYPHYVVTNAIGGSSSASAHHITAVVGNPDRLRHARIILAVLGGDEAMEEQAEAFVLVRPKVQSKATPPSWDFDILKFAPRREPAQPQRPPWETSAFIAEARAANQHRW